MQTQHDSRAGGGGAALLALLYAAAIAVLLIAYFAFEPPRGFWVNLLTAVFTWVFFMAATMQGARALAEFQPERPAPAVTHGFWGVSALYSLLVIGALFVWLPQGGADAASDTTFLVFLGLFTLLGASVAGTLYSWGTRLAAAEAPAAAAREEHAGSGRQLEDLLEQLQRLTPPPPEHQPALQQATRDLRKCATALKHSHGGRGGAGLAGLAGPLAVSNAAEEAALAIRLALRSLSESPDTAPWSAGLEAINAALQGLLTTLKAERLV